MSNTIANQQNTIAEVIRRGLDRIAILPRRILLETPCVNASVPMLRGVWGAALYELDRAVYERVFEGKTAAAADGRPTDTPGYVVRPAPADPDFAPAMEWILIGDAILDDEVLLRGGTWPAGWGWGRIGGGSICGNPRVWMRRTGRARRAPHGIWARSSGRGSDRQRRRAGCDSTRRCDCGGREV